MTESNESELSQSGRVATRVIPSGTPDQWRERQAFTFHCARCAAPLRDYEGEGEAWFSGESPITAYEALDEQGWTEISDAWYCPKCFHTCWDADSEPRLDSESACQTCKVARDV